MKLRKNWHSLLPALATFLSFFLQPHSLAYQFTEDLIRGSFWRTFPIPLKIQLSKDDARFDMTEQALVQAMEEWQRHSSTLELWDYRGGPSVTSTSNVIRWSNNFERETGYSVHSTMAVTVRYATPPLIQRTEIIINGQYAGLENVDDLKMILVHELGHTIGLDHTNVGGSMMFRALSLGGGGNSSLSNDDIEGLDQVILYHSQKQSEPIQLEQNRRSSSNPFEGIASCGQNNQDVLSFSPAENTKKYSLLLFSWFFSLGLGLMVPLCILLSLKLSKRLRKKNSRHFHS